MSIWHWLTSRVAGLRQHRRRMNDLQRELQAHLELEAEEERESGSSPEESHYAARRAFGNTSFITEDVRAIWTFTALEAFIRDLRYGARALRKNFGFTAVAVLTLALGIGANTTIFSAMNALLLRPLPFPAADQLVRIYSTKTNSGSSTGLIGPSSLDVRDFATASHSFQNMVVYDTWRKNVSFGASGAEPEQMRVGLMPAAYFEILGVQPIAGRLFTGEENQQGRNYVAAISARVWRTRFSADPAILGRKLRINDEPYTIIAVMPDLIPEWMEPWRPGPIEIWTPFLNSWSETTRAGRGNAAIARMKPGVSLKQAQEDLSTIAVALATAHPMDEGIGVMIVPLADTRAGKLRPMLFLLMGAVTLILLIACVNLATCSWHAIPLGNASWRCARHWAQAEAGSCATCSQRLCFLR